jgi:phage shock protein PspC (stress-responsive transcriptional regulator)
MSNKRLARNTSDQMIFGVAAGLADYLNIDPVLVRVIFVLLALSTGWGIVIYLVLAVLMPEERDPVAKAHVLDEEEIIIKDA